MWLGSHEYKEFLIFSEIGSVFPSLLQNSDKKPIRTNNCKRNKMIIVI
jgi:hypothetical protein